MIAGHYSYGLHNPAGRAVATSSAWHFVHPVVPDEHVFCGIDRVRCPELPNFTMGAVRSESDGQATGPQKTSRVAHDTDRRRGR